MVHQSASLPCFEMTDSGRTQDPSTQNKEFHMGMAPAPPGDHTTVPSTQSRGFIPKLAPTLVPLASLGMRILGFQSQVPTDDTQKCSPRPHILWGSAHTSQQSWPRSLSFWVGRPESGQGRLPLGPGDIPACSAFPSSCTGSVSLQKKPKHLHQPVQKT
jgi:hypothetical protein